MGINGIAHPIGSSWANPFDPKCSKCHCVKGDKCLAAKTECEEVPTKDCVVFCKEGEWYYPPSKEQCENTCGPCCGRCAQPKCNAESGAVPANKTVGILKVRRTTKQKSTDCAAAPALVVSLIHPNGRLATKTALV